MILLDTLLRKDRGKKRSSMLLKKDWQDPKRDTTGSLSQLKGLLKLGGEGLLPVAFLLFGMHKIFKYQISFPLKPHNHHSTEQPGTGEDVQRRRSSAAAARGDEQLEQLIFSWKR